MFEFPEKLEFEHFEQMFDLECSYYSEDFITPADEAWRWYAQHPHSVVAALHDGAVVGFVNLFPVRIELFEEICAGRFNDANLVAEDIVSLDELSASEDEVGMFLSCIVVDVRYRRQGLTKTLLGKAADMYRPYRKRIEKIAMDTVTSEGFDFARRYGFELQGETDHGSFVHVQEFDGFLEALAHA